MAQQNTTIVYPKPGRTIFLPGGVHGFDGGPVPMRADHAEALGHHVVTEAEKKAADDQADAAKRAIDDAAAADGARNPSANGVRAAEGKAKSASA